MDIPGPWTFQLRNPRNPKELMTHSGVLEFIASEGVVHLPAWVCPFYLTYRSLLDSRA
jgi:ubiquitin fusion degradation protein 1